MQIFLFKILVKHEKKLLIRSIRQTVANMLAAFFHVVFKKIGQNIQFSSPTVGVGARPPSTVWQIMDPSLNSIQDAEGIFDVIMATGGGGSKSGHLYEEDDRLDKKLLNKAANVLAAGLLNGSRLVTGGSPSLILM